MVMYLILGAHFLSGRETDIETATCLQTGLGTDFLFLSVLKTCLCSTIPLRENRHEPAPAGTQSRTYRLPLPQHTFPPPPPETSFSERPPALPLLAAAAFPCGVPAPQGKKSISAQDGAGNRPAPHILPQSRKATCAAISASFPIPWENIRSLFQKELKSE